LARTAEVHVSGAIPFGGFMPEGMPELVSAMSTMQFMSYVSSAADVILKGSVDNNGNIYEGYSFGYHPTYILKRPAYKTLNMLADIAGDYPKAKELAELFFRQNKFLYSTTGGYPSDVSSAARPPDNEWFVLEALVGLYNRWQT